MRLALFLLMLILSCSAFAQRQYDDLFSPAAKDTVTQAARTVTTSKIVFTSPFKRLDGMVNAYGSVKVLAGGDTTVSVRARMFFGESASDPSPWYDLDAIADAANGVGDSTLFVYPMARQSFWTDCSAYELEFSIPAGGTRTLEITGKSAAR